MYLPLYWLYLWQINEYRTDRLRNFIASLPVAKRITTFIWGEYRRPKVSAKLGVIAGLAFLLSFMLVVLVGYLGEFSIGWVLIAIIFGWITSPLTISVAVWGVRIIEQPIKQRVYQRARETIKRHASSTPIIGITGSYGKTTTKEFVAQILGTQYDVASAPRHVNYELAIAQFINQKVDHTFDFLVIEYASYGIGNIKKDIETIVAPTEAILTGINEQHVTLFGSIENTIQAKFELVDALPQEAPVFYNADDATLSAAVNDRLHQRNTIPCSVHDIGWVWDKLSWSDTVRGKVLQTMFGSNLACAIAVAMHHGMDQSAIKAAVENIAWLPRTVEVYERGDTVFIDDSYSSNPEGFKRLVEFVASIEKKRKILITTGIFELGKESERINAEIAKQAVSVFDRIYVTHPATVEAWIGVDERIVDFSDEHQWHADLSITDADIVVIEGRIHAYLYDKIRSER